ATRHGHVARLAGQPQAGVVLARQLDDLSGAQRTSDDRATERTELHETAGLDRPGRTDELARTAVEARPGADAERVGRLARQVRVAHVAVVEDRAAREPGGQDETEQQEEQQEGAGADLDPRAVALPERERHDVEEDVELDGALLVARRLDRA